MSQEVLDGDAPQSYDAWLAMPMCYLQSIVFATSLTIAMVSGRTLEAKFCTGLRYEYEGLPSYEYSRTTNVTLHKLRLLGATDGQGTPGTRSFLGSFRRLPRLGISHDGPLRKPQLQKCVVGGSRRLRVT